jgi:large subunit ribosomal protein L25
MTAQSLEIQVRDTFGTGNARAARRAGMVPGVVYGNKKEPAHFNIEERLLVKHMKERGFFSHLFDVTLDGAKQQVLVRDVQLHPVSDRPLSLDLMRVSKSSKITVDVSLSFINEEASVGLRDGGILNVLRHSLPLICSPGSIPEAIEIDLSTLNIGDALYLENVILPEGVQVAHPEKIETILTIAQPKAEVEEETGAHVDVFPEEDASAEEGAADSTEESDA